MSAPHLTLIVPHLLWPEPGNEIAFGHPGLTGLDTLLARARFGRDPELAWEDCLAACFPGDHGNLAELRRQGEADTTSEPGGHWLCADPVSLKFHHERVVLADSSCFQLRDDESAELVAGLNREFGDLGQFDAPHPQRWYLRAENAIDWPARPLSAAAGRTLELPENSRFAMIRRWMNEIQMFLHDHPVNRARETRGEPPVNSLWLWGANTGSSLRFFPDEKPEAALLSPSAVWSSQPLAIGLARAARLAQFPDVADAGSLLAQAAPPKHALVLLDSLLAPALYEDSDTWRAELVRLEEHWFAPLLARRLPLTLIAPTRYGCLRWDLQPLDTWKFWRRPQPLAALARSLAAE